jgi:RNA polymerase sigma-70 factor, ECF subfamily
MYGTPCTTPPSPAGASARDSAPDSTPDSTVEVLARARGGDRSAALVLLERALPAVRRWAHGRLPGSVRPDADTEDVVQDVVLRALRGLAEFEHRTVGGLQAYLRTSVVNRIRDLVRAAGRRGVVEPLEEELDAPPGVAPAAALHALTPSPLEAVLMREQLDRFLAALQRLRPADRQLVVWRVELGYGVDEIAARLGKSKPAAGMAISRAMSRLAEQLRRDAGAE